MYYIYNSSNGMAYTNLIGKFSYRSTRGNRYVIVAYNYDENAILTDPVKNRQATTLLEAWEFINENILRREFVQIHTSWTMKYPMT